MIIKYYKCLLLSFLITIFQLNAATTYPLGGVWREGFGASHDAIHRELCRREMAIFTQSEEGKVEDTTNVATFRLVGWKSGGATPFTLLECAEDDFCFCSGNACNNIVIEDGKVRFKEYDVGEREVLSKRIKKPDGKDTITEDIAGLARLEADVKQLREIHECMGTYVENYPLAEIKKILGSQRELKKASEQAHLAPGAMKHLFDSEQSIMRCVEVYLGQEGLDLSSYDGFSFHVHNRFDTCRHCLACMHERAKSMVWKKNLGGKPLAVFVTSRQDYRDVSGIKFSGQEYYSMRFIGCDDHSHEPFDAERDKTLVEAGIIFQAAIPHAAQISIARDLRPAAGAGAGAGR